MAYTDLDEWFGHIRSDKLAGVAFFHRFASSVEELRAVRARIAKAGIVVLELAAGRRTDNPDDYANMVDEARDFYGRTGLSPAEARYYGKLGAKKSPVTKSRTDRLPNELAEKFLNDHATYPTVKLALRAINSAKDARGKRFKRKWNVTHISRMVKAGKLNLKPRRSGPKVKA